MAKEEKEKKIKGLTLASQRRSFKALKSPEHNHAISTGSLNLDIFMDGGFRAGMSRFSAPEEHGKTSMFLLWCNNTLTYFGDKGIKCKIVIYDAEGRMTAHKLEVSGLPNNKYFNEDTFEFYRTNIYEDISEDIYEKVQNEQDTKFVFLIDSLDYLITRGGLEKGFDEHDKIAASASISNVLCKKLAPYLFDRGNYFFITSQLRANINMSNPNSPPTRVAGGFMLKHAMSLNGEIQQNGSFNFIYTNENGKTLAEKGEVLGHYMTIKFKKTFNDKSNRVIRVPISYKKGIWVERELIDISIQYELIKKGGAWFSLNEDLAKDINENLPKFIRNIEIESKVIDEVKKHIAENDKPPTEKQLEKKRAEIADAIKEQVFSVETKWQGLPSVYKYIESSPDLVKYLFDKFKKTLVISGERTEADEGDEG